MSLHEEFMKKAAKLSIENIEKERGGPFGAVIVKDGKIIGVGSNSVTTSNDPTAHAEVSAIRDACKNLNDYQLTGAVIYTSCEPCPMCLSAIYWARIEGIYFSNSREDAAAIGFDDEFLYQEVNKTLNERTIPIQQVIVSEAKEAFIKWDNDLNKTPY